MFKVHFLLSSTADPFKAHGQAAAYLVARACPNVAGYLQTRACQEQIDGGPQTSFNATAELWFRYAAHAVAAARHGCGDLVNEGTEVQATHCGIERVVMKKPEHWRSECVKGVYPFRRKRGMAVDAFQRYWWHNHGPIAALTKGALCYTQTHALEQCYEGGEPDCDGITELHWLDTDAARRAVASRQMVEDQSEDAPKFVDTESVELLLVNQEICIAP